MIELVINIETKVAHIRENGKTFEQCNIDQIRTKSVRDHVSISSAAEYAESAGYALCERCFYDTHTA